MKRYFFITMFARTFRPTYQGPVKACILDWSGTVLDRYVIAPAVVFVDVFKSQGVDITMTEARGPMGLRKDLHIKALTEVPAIRERWTQIHQHEPTDEDVARMFEDFVPKQLACLSNYTEMIPGAVETVNTIQKSGIKIGMTTGFTRSMVDVLLKESQEHGYFPEVTVAGDEVEHGARPGPFMVYRNLDLLGIYPIESVVKVDDTVGGVGEGLNAGCWSVGVSRYSNYMDINSYQEEDSLTETQLEERNLVSRQKLLDAGAHFVIDSIIQLPRVIEHINGLLKAKITPLTEVTHSSQ